MACPRRLLRRASKGNCPLDAPQHHTSDSTVVGATERASACKSRDHDGPSQGIGIAQSDRTFRISCEWSYNMCHALRYKGALHLKQGLLYTKVKFIHDLQNEATPSEFQAAGNRSPFYGISFTKA